MERFISACRNPLAKSATTKAIGYATQVPNASAKIRRTFWVLQIFFEKNEKKLFNYVKNEDELHELQNCT